jgi:hypothetical protein
MADEEKRDDILREEMAEPDDEGEDAEIQDLLDVGYEQLDGFVSWLEERLGVDSRTAQQDCFNAESLIDYLANHQHKTAADVNEFELRWFVFSHYIRKAMADPVTEERLPDSLHRFYEYLRSEHGVQVSPWLYDVLDDRNYYQARRKHFAALNSEDEREWQEGFSAWSRELEEDLDARSLWLPRDLGDGMVWVDPMGWREATLYAEANRQWQNERAHLLEEGLDFESVRDRLYAAYLIWLDAPQDKLDNLTPREVIFDERQERAETEEAGQEEEG